MPDEYYTRHADTYDLSAPGIEGDIAFYRDLAVASGGPIVELGVGTGRVAIPTAEAGIDVTGIDDAVPMLEIAREKAREAGVEERLRLIEGDMRSFTVEEPVPLVTIPYRSFNHNLDVADQEATLEACRRALREGGQLALNLFNPDPRLVEGWYGLSPQHWDGKASPGASSVVRSSLRVRDAAGARHTTHVRLRVARRDEMAALLERCGFRVEALYGDFFGTPFTEQATEQIWVATRAR